MNYYVSFHYCILEIFCLLSFGYSEGSITVNPKLVIFIPKLEKRFFVWKETNYTPSLVVRLFRAARRSLFRTPVENKSAWSKFLSMCFYFIIKFPSNFQFLANIYRKRSWHFTLPSFQNFQNSVLTWHFWLKITNGSRTSIFSSLSCEPCKNS